MNRASTLTMFAVALLFLTAAPAQGQPAPAAQTGAATEAEPDVQPEPETPEPAVEPELERAIGLIEEGDFAAAADVLAAFTSRPASEQRLSSEAREMVLAYLYYGIARLYVAGEDDARRAFQDAQRLDPEYEPEASALPRRVMELWREVRDLGALVVITAPDAAAVYLDGEMRGYAPVDVAMLAPGDYRVTVTREGYQDDTRVVTVVSGGESTVRVEMAPMSPAPSAVEAAGTGVGAPVGTGQAAAPPAAGGGGLGTGALVGIVGAAGAAVGVGVAVGGGADAAPTPTPQPDPPASVPSAPGAPTLTAGDGQLVARWTAPSANGAAIDDYDVRYRTGGGGWTELPDTVKSTATERTISGLANGATYEVQVRAGNAVGDGPWSASAMGTPVAPTSPDRAVLIELYNATNGPSWTRNTNWNSTAPLDQWDGVFTNAQGRVSALSLLDNQLTGSIPSSLGSLTSLQQLDLDQNQLGAALLRRRSR